MSLFPLYERLRISWFSVFALTDIGFEIPNRFVVGYALDYNEYFRDLNVSMKRFRERRERHGRGEGTRWIKEMLPTSWNPNSPGRCPPSLRRLEMKQTAQIFSLCGWLVSLSICQKSVQILVWSFKPMFTFILKIITMEVWKFIAGQPSWTFSHIKKIKKVKSIKHIYVASNWSLERPSTAFQRSSWGQTVRKSKPEAPKESVSSLNDQV